MSKQLKKFSTPVGIDVNHDYRVRIPYNLVYNAMTGSDIWNETCARAIEMFGLPGNKYTCRFTSECIEFWFLDEKDALMFELSCG